MGDDRIGTELASIYQSSVRIIAYATGGFADDFPTRALESFKSGPVAMRAFVQDLKDRDYEGWGLPNPNYHRAVLNF